MNFYPLGQRGALSLFGVKTSAPRWAKEITGLSKPSQTKLLGMGANLREVKPLGQGGERIADLVAHPKHGLVVRKVPLIQQTDPRHVAEVNAYAAQQRGMEHHLKGIAQGGGPFAHILEEGSKGEAYYQYARGRPADADLSAQHATLQRQEEQAYHTLSAMDDRGEGRAPALARYNALADQLRDVRLAIKTPSDPPPGAAPVLQQLKQKYPGFHDLRGANIVGGRVVDLSPGGGGPITHYMDQAPSPLPAAALSKRHYLGAKG